jgi:hypothetical protein
LSCAPDHRLDEVGLGDVRDISRCNTPSVPQHRVTLTKLEDFLQSVSNEGDGASVCLKAAYDVEKQSHFLLAQRSRGLVKDQDARLHGQAARDLHELLFGDRYIPNDLTRIALEPYRPAIAPGLRQKGMPRNETATSLLAPKEDVLGD